MRERIATVQHEIWSHWMKHLFSICPIMSNGDVVIKSNEVLRWSRQMRTSYPELTEKEKESERDQADKVISALEIK